MAISQFWANFVGHFCYHSNGKKWINARILHLSYSSNNQIRKTLVKSNFQYLAPEGGKLAPLMHKKLGLRKAYIKVLCFKQKTM